MKLAEEIADERKSLGLLVADFFVESTPESAWAFVNQETGLVTTSEKSDEERAKELICIAGSAFLVAELRKTCIAARIKG